MITDIVEDRTCHYSLKVTSPLLCLLTDFAPPRVEVSMTLYVYDYHACVFALTYCYYVCVCYVNDVLKIERMILTPKPNVDDDDLYDEGDDSGDGVGANELAVGSELEPQEPTLVEATTAARPAADQSFFDLGEEEEPVVSVEAVAEILQDLVVDGDLAHLTDITGEDLILETEAQLTDDSVMMTKSDATVAEEVEDKYDEVKEEEEWDGESSEDNSKSYLFSDGQQDQGVEVGRGEKVGEELSVDSNNGDKPHQEGEHGEEGDALEHSTPPSISYTPTTNNDDTTDRVKDEL